jgi:RHS repeat-associated protein
MAKKIWLSYDKAANRTSEQIDLNVTSSSYNNLNQLTSQNGGGPLRLSGTVNQPTTVTVNGAAASTTTALNSSSFTAQVSATTGTNVFTVVAKDPSGYATINNYQVVVPPNSATTPTYDLNGNLTNNGSGQTYAWDAKNELVTITYTGGATTNFTYDGLNRRTKIVEKNSGGTITSTKQFVWLGNSMAEERDASNTVTKRFFAQGEQQGGTAYYYTRDHLGSIREMCDSSGNIVARYDYDPYGRVTPVGTILVPSDFQYAGYYEHAPSGLNLTRGGSGGSTGRPYDPNTGKWLSRDPLKNAEMSQGPNLYQYVQNEPLNRTDPLGLCDCGNNSSDSGVYNAGRTGVRFAAGFVGLNIGWFAGGTVGMWAGGAIGAPVGGLVGMLGGPEGELAGLASGALIGGTIGEVAGSLVGGADGAYAAQYIAEQAYDAIFGCPTPSNATSSPPSSVPPSGLPRQS